LGENDSERAQPKSPKNQRMNHTVFTVGVNLAIGNPAGAKARISGGCRRHG
jgi:hypothetical protein